ncbi:hypothetical protein [Fructobacillus cardui]|uniref:hypothetical protein n=1 Tax=Fructobacillus cardui TaxID=2893170 RepID=UPI00200A1CC0|nr:hypothetical protein [Fructobacillus cardui]MCK8627049.1 hypothetical protein [Fructobacillus cardui]
MSTETINLVAVIFIIVGSLLSLLSVVFAEIPTGVPIILLAIGWGVILFNVCWPNFEQWQKEERISKVSHLQSEIPDEVSLRKLDSQLKHRDIDLDDADSVSYDNGVLKIFFSDWNLFTGTQATTWSVKLHDNAIDSTSRSRS